MKYLIILNILMGLAGPVYAELSDAQKKQIVYQMYADYKKDFPSVKDIMPVEAMKLYKADKAVFVDTRKPEEMKISMLPNAISQYEFIKNKIKYKNKILITYCTISYRSGKFIEKTAPKDFIIYNLNGGLLAWVLEGQKVYDAKGEIRRIHVYGKKWDYPPKGYESVKFGLLNRFF